MAHILTYGYNANLAFSRSVSKIDDYARALLEGLIIRRTKMKSTKNPLVFICHSLGGIVFKKVMIISLSIYEVLTSPRHSYLLTSVTTGTGIC